MNRRLRAAGLAQGFDWREFQGGAAGADQKRRNEDVQAVERIGLKEVRHGPRPALDEQPPQTDRGQGAYDRVRVDRAGRPLGNKFFCARGSRTGLGMDDNPADAVRREHPRRPWGAPSRIDHDPGGAAPRHPSNGQLRIVGNHRSHPDDHGIDLRAQPVEVIECGGTVDVTRVTAYCRDSPVQRLSKLPNNKRLAGECLEPRNAYGNGFWAPHLSIILPAQASRNAYMTMSGSARYVICASCWCESL